MPAKLLRFGLQSVINERKTPLSVNEPSPTLLTVVPASDSILTLTLADTASKSLSIVTAMFAETSFPDFCMKSRTMLAIAP